MADNTLPSGPTASYPNDPNDFQTSGGFNVNSFVDSLFDAIPGILSGSAQIYGATHNQPVTYNAPWQPVYAPAGNPPAQPQSNNTVLYIVLVVIVLILVLGGAYFISRK